MKNIDIFKIWSNSSSKWINWVRPVPFISIDDNLNLHTCNNIEIKPITYVNNTSSFYSDLAIIVDLPNTDSISEGLSLAKIGFIPIPVFNGCDTQKRCNVHSR